MSALTEKEQRMLLEMHSCLMNPEYGLCVVVKGLDKAINGNGSIGLKTQTRILWVLALGLWAIFLALVPTLAKVVHKGLSV